MVDGFENAGVHSVFWNGMDQNGQAVAGGVYIQRMTAIAVNDRKSFVQTGKMFLAK